MPNSWRLVRRAEELGFSHAWFYDTQMLSADCFVAMAAAAMKTTRIRLGTGVLIPSNRIAAVAANAFASLNQLAPGRIDFGVGTGFTGRRAMGLGAIRLAEMEDYIRVVHGAAARRRRGDRDRGQAADHPAAQPRGRADQHARSDPAAHRRLRPARPRADRQAGRRLDRHRRGRGEGRRPGWARCAKAWQAAGHAPEALTAVAFAAGAVLEEGEAFDSPRAMAVAGPRAATLLHRAADEALAGLPNTAGVAPELAGTVAAYVEHARSFRPQGAHYLTNHRGHLMFVRPDERPFVTAELIRRMTFTGTERDLKQRIEAFEAAGFAQIAFSIPPGQEHAIEDWGRVRRAFG